MNQVSTLIYASRWSQGCKFEQNRANIDQDKSSKVYNNFSYHQKSKFYVILRQLLSPQDNSIKKESSRSARENKSLFIVEKSKSSQSSSKPPPNVLTKPTDVTNSAPFTKTTCNTTTQVQ